MAGEDRFDGGVLVNLVDDDDPRSLHLGLAESVHPAMQVLARRHEATLPTRSPARTPLRLPLAVQPFHLERALAVEACLLDEPGAELGERGCEDVDLVQRVLDVELGVDLELEVDPIRAVRDLEDDARPRVDVPAPLVAERVALGDLTA